MYFTTWGGKPVYVEWGLQRISSVCTKPTNEVSFRASQPLWASLTPVNHWWAQTIWRFKDLDLPFLQRIFFSSWHLWEVPFSSGLGTTS